MARKAKKRTRQMPPLSLGDKLIYWTILLLLCAVYFLLLYIPIRLGQKIAFSDEMVIAAEENAGFLWILVPWMTFFLMTFILWYQPYQKRKPIFGRKNFKYGPPAWPKEYPLFMKNKPCVYISERQKKGRKQIAAILLVILLVSFIPFPLALWGRKCLHSDGSVVQYNMFNRQTHEFTSGDFSEICIKTYRYSTGKYNRTRHWGVLIEFVTDSGKKYTFEHSAFRDSPEGGAMDWLGAMHQIKNRYDPESIYYEGVDDLERVIADKELSEEETVLLYQLFEQ